MREHASTISAWIAREKLTVVAMLLSFSGWALGIAALAGVRL